MEQLTEEPPFSDRICPAKIAPFVEIIDTTETNQLSTDRNLFCDCSEGPQPGGRKVLGVTLPDKRPGHWVCGRLLEDLDN